MAAQGVVPLATQVTTATLMERASAIRNFRACLFIRGKIREGLLGSREMLDMGLSSLSQHSNDFKASWQSCIVKI